MVGWHHWLNGHESEQAPGDGEGQGSLACCSPWGCKELATTERLNNNEQTTEKQQRGRHWRYRSDGDNRWSDILEVLIQAWLHQWDALLIALILSLYPIRTLFYYIIDSHTSAGSATNSSIYKPCSSKFPGKILEEEKNKMNLVVESRIQPERVLYLVISFFIATWAIKWPHNWVFFIQQAVSVIKTTQPQNLHDKVEISAKSKLFQILDFPDCLNWIRVYFKPLYYTYIHREPTKICCSPGH